MKPDTCPLSDSESSPGWRQALGVPSELFELGYPCVAAAIISARKSRRRSVCALSATTIVERDMRIAPTDIGSTNPIGARTPAASGTDIRLYPAAHQRFCRNFR